MFRAIKITFKSLAISLSLLSLVLNLAIFTISGAYTAVSTAIAGMGVATAATREVAERRAKKKARREITKQTVNRMTKRIATSAARNIGTSAGEAIPVVGVAVIAGGLALEVNDACANARDITALEAALESDTDPEAARQLAHDSFDCKTLVPSYDDLPTKEELWNSVKSAPSDAWNGASNYIEMLPAMPDMSSISGFFEGAVGSGKDWMEYAGQGMKSGAQSLGDMASDQVTRLGEWWEGDTESGTDVPCDSC